MPFYKCPICNQYDFPDTHKCPPIYYFKHPHWGDEFQKIHASSFENAAEEFAKIYNEDGDYYLMDNEEIVIISNGKIEKTFKVSARQSIEYDIKEIIKELPDEKKKEI